MEKATFMLAEISAAMLGFQDVARAVAFYRDKLGLSARRQAFGDTTAARGGYWSSKKYSFGPTAHRITEVRLQAQRGDG